MRTARRRGLHVAATSPAEGMSVEQIVRDNVFPTLALIEAACARQFRYVQDASAIALATRARRLRVEPLAGTDRSAMVCMRYSIWRPPGPAFCSSIDQ